MNLDVSALKARFPDIEIKENVSLAPFTYMKVGGNAKVLAEVKNRDSLFELCSYCFTNQVPFVIFGGASNLVIADAGIDKLVIHNGANHITVFPSDTDEVIVEADSGVVTAVLANRTMSQDLTGMEFFVGVPGTVGGAIFNNSHFTSKELIGNLVQNVHVCTTEGKREIWGPEKLQFAYDHSVFQKQPDVILGVTFLLRKGDPKVISQTVQEVARKRTSTQPIGIPNSGCMYRNPIITASQLQAVQAKLEVPPAAFHEQENGNYQIAAGFLIDRAGLKGTTVGGAQVSEKHATFIVNKGNATATDIENLCQIVEAKVQEQFGVKLEREVFFLS